jgi:5-methylcytosine-specific restriction endonuclease McrA
MMDYTEYLTTPHWKQIAYQAKERAEWQCALCARHGERLHVHHRTYARLGHERETDLIVLCWSCHAKFHGTFEECAEKQITLPYIPHGVDLN